MAYINSFTYCEDIQQEVINGGIVPKIVNPLTELQTLFMPTHYSFAVSCAISGVNINNDKSIRIVFMSPSGKIVNDTGKINISNFPRNKETTGNLKFNLIMKNVALQETGIYETKIELNDEELQSFKIEVKKVEKK